MCVCEIADIVDNISMGLKCRGNNHKRHNKRHINGGKLSSLFTNPSSDPEMSVTLDLNRVGGGLMKGKLQLTGRKGLTRFLNFLGEVVIC